MIRRVDLSRLVEAHMGTGRRTGDADKGFGYQTLQTSQERPHKKKQKKKPSAMFYSFILDPDQSTI